MHLTEHFLFSQNVLVLISQDHLVLIYLAFEVSEDIAQTRALQQSEVVSIPSGANLSSK